MKLSSVPGFPTIIHLDKVLHHSLHNDYIENSQNAAFGSHVISKLTKTKVALIAKVKTSFYSLFRVEKMFQWRRLFVFTRSACGNEKRSAEPQGHQFSVCSTVSIYFWYEVCGFSISEDSTLVITELAEGERKATMSSPYVMLTRAPHEALGTL